MNQVEATSKKILAHVNEELIFGNETARADEDLLESGLLDSISVFGLVQFVRDAFDIDVPPQDIILEHFGSVDLIAAYVVRKTQEPA